MLGVPDYQVEGERPRITRSRSALRSRVGGQVLGAGQGRTKKAAEQQAAECCLAGHHGRVVRALAPENGPRERQGERQPARRQGRQGRQGRAGALRRA